MNSLPLSPVVISYATLQRKPLLTSPQEGGGAVTEMRDNIFLGIFWVPRISNTTDTDPLGTHLSEKEIWESHGSKKI